MWARDEAKLAQLTSSAADTLADYLEALAGSLRHQARSEQAQLAERRETYQRRAEAVQQARQLIAAGMDRERAQRTAARHGAVAVEYIAANIEQLESLEDEQRRQRQLAAAEAMRRRGKTLRQIAEATGLARSTIHDALGRRDRPGTAEGKTRRKDKD